MCCDDIRDVAPRCAAVASLEHGKEVKNDHIPYDQWSRTKGAWLACATRLVGRVPTVPHHGGDTSLTVPFPEAVSPEVVIISGGGDNRFGHPDEPTLENLGAIQSPRTDQRGCIQLEKMARHIRSGSGVELSSDAPTIVTIRIRGRTTVRQTVSPMRSFSLRFHAGGGNEVIQSLSRPECGRAIRQRSLAVRRQYGA